MTERKDIQPKLFDYDFLRMKLLDDSIRVIDASSEHENPFWFAFMDVCLDCSLMPEWLFYNPEFKGKKRFPDVTAFLGHVRKEFFFIGCASELSLAFKHVGLSPDKSTSLAARVDAMTTEYVEDKIVEFGSKYAQEIKLKIEPVFEFKSGKPQKIDVRRFCQSVMSEFEDVDDEFLRGMS